MTIPQKILTDLLISQSSTDAIALRLRSSEPAILAICQRHKTDGLLESFKIADTITVWRLTSTGYAAAAVLDPSLASRPFAQAKPNPQHP